MATKTKSKPKPTSAGERSFSPALFTFLKDLRKNNDRDWFNENKDRYREVLQEPALDFIEAFRPRLEKISPHFLAEAKPVGGSLFRIHRDVRFSKDKTPYKTSVGIHFRHETAKSAHAPVFYLHIEPGECFVGIGIWQPEAPVARRIREQIAERPADWKRAVRGKRFAETFSLGGESLKRPPKGFDPDHPLIDDIKRKSFIASAPLRQADVTASGFIDEYAALCRTGAPLVKFLCGALRAEF